MRLLYTLVLLVISVGSAHAQSSDKVWIESCKNFYRLEGYVDAHDAYRQGYCIGVLTGSFFASNQTCMVGDKYPTGEQLIKAFVNFIDKNPSRQGEALEIVANDAMISAFPCRR